MSLMQFLAEYTEVVIVILASLLVMAIISPLIIYDIMLELGVRFV